MSFDPVIYCITNIINDKQYVGQAIIKSKRWKNHRIALQYNKHENRHLQAAYNKYGAENFVFTVVQKVDWIHLLNQREQYWMDKLDCVDPKGYNLQPTAGSSRGFKHTEETKLKWSAQRKGQKRSAEFAASVSARMTGKAISEETRRKLVESHKGHKHSAETKAKMSEARKGNKNAAGRKQSAEEIEHRTSFVRGARRTAETKAKMSAAQKGRRMSEETKIKMSISAKRRWETPLTIFNI